MIVVPLILLAFVTVYLIVMAVALRLNPEQKEVERSDEYPRSHFQVQSQVYDWAKEPDLA